MDSEIGQKIRTTNDYCPAKYSYFVNHELLKYHLPDATDRKIDPGFPFRY